MRCKRVLSAGFLLFVFYVYPIMSAVPGAVAPQIESALLAADWKAVAGGCGPAERLKDKPVLRVLAGHAMLARNRNNESLELFRASSGPEELAAWKAWTVQFAAANPGNPVAQYLLGDARARLEDWNGALEAFNEALRLRPDFALALNARGAVRCATGGWGEGREDFARATQADPQLADAYASSGTAQLLTKSPAGLADFQKALNRSPQFALAHNGLGGSEFLLGAQHLGQAAESFQSAAKQMPLPIVAFNLNSSLEANADIASRKNLYFAVPQFEPKAWPLCRAAILDQGHPLHRYFADSALPPDQVTRPVVDRFNQLLELPSFYEEHQAALSAALAHKPSTTTEELRTLLDETRSIRQKAPSSRNTFERARIRGLNRALLDTLLPCLKEGALARTGMSLTKNGGITFDALSYKRGLSSYELTTKMLDMQYKYKPLANLVSEIPGLGFLGKQWNEHLDNQIGINKSILEEKGINSQYGGVDTNMEEAFFKMGKWTVGNWFGLGYKVEPKAH